MNNWAQIYHCADLIKSYDPWAQFGERDLFVWQPKENGREYFFSFLRESCGSRGIAFYENGNDCFLAQERLHGKNNKKEPVFLLQNAVILLWSDREALSKDSYRRIKELGLKFRGKGCWPHFQQYRIGYLPKTVPEEATDCLLEQIESLLKMLQDVNAQQMKVSFINDHVLLRSYQESAKDYSTYTASLLRHRRGVYRQIAMEDNDWLQDLTKEKPRGTVAIDWAYCTKIMENAEEGMIPCLAMAVNPRTGCLLEKMFFTPESPPYENMLVFMDYLFQHHGKPVSIEICDREIESYIRSICDRTGIRLIVKPRLRYMEILRREQMAE